MGCACRGDASSVKDTFTVKGSNTCTAETYWISLTIQFEVSSSSQTWYWSTQISINDSSCACNISFRWGYFGGIQTFRVCKNFKTSLKGQIWMNIFMKSFTISISRECSFTSMYSIVLVGICNWLSRYKGTFFFRKNGERLLKLVEDGGSTWFSTIRRDVFR